MPSWKKVITSGSNAQLNQITASGFNLALNMLREGNYFNKLRNDATKDEALNAIGQVLDNFETGYKKNSKQDAMAKSELSKLRKVASGKFPKEYVEKYF